MFKATLIILTIINSLLFTFTLLSGSSGYDENINNILYNFPNTLPWLIVFALIFLSWKKPLLGGIGLILTAITYTFFFGLYKAPAIWLLFFIPFPLITAGIILIICRFTTEK